MQPVKSISDLISGVAEKEKGLPAQPFFFGLWNLKFPQVMFKIEQIILDPFSFK